MDGVSDEEKYSLIAQLAQSVPLTWERLSVRFRLGLLAG